MKKYRVLHLKYKSNTLYIPQKRYCIFFWKNMTEATSSIEVAISDILDHISVNDLHYNKKDIDHKFVYE
jgi:hypothetical protein